MKDENVIKLIEKHKLNVQNSVTLANGLYLVEKLNKDVRVLYRTKPGERCTIVASENQSIPEGAQTFIFANVRTFVKDYDEQHEIMVPPVFVKAATKSVFIVTVNNGFATFTARQASKTDIDKVLSDEVEA